MNRFWKYRNIPDSKWENWRWQLANRLKNNSNLKEYFPYITESSLLDFNAYVKKFSIGITPYTLSLVKLESNLNPVADDPVWNQIKYLPLNKLCSQYDYDGIQSNWELSEEMPTDMLHHKYPDRAIIRIVNCCIGYCSYCYLTKRILDIGSKKQMTRDKTSWSKTISYLKRHKEIRDILISGGDPLLLSNVQLDSLLSDLTKIKSIKSIRLNTRSLTFNPYRFDRELVKIFKKYKLNSLEIQVGHPREITDTFDDVLSLFDDIGYRPQLLWRAPLLKGINDSYEVLEDLFLKLYVRRIMPYYLFHCSPYSLGRSIFGTSIKKGIEILSRLRRRVPGPAFPRFTLFHIQGKQDIPLEIKGTPNFQFLNDSKGKPIVRFKNWKGQWVIYPDVE